jgi:putative transposase
VISHCVWLYFRFPLSFREVEELMLERGVIVSYETVRRWCLKFGQQYANALRHRRPRPGDKWHLDEVFIKVNGEQKYLWRAVDQDGNVLDILVQDRRDTAAAKRFFRRLMKKTGGVPRVVVTDKLRSYGAAHREIMPSVEHRSHKGLNNRGHLRHQIQVLTLRTPSWRHRTPVSSNGCGSPGTTSRSCRPRALLCPDRARHLLFTPSTAASCLCRSVRGWCCGLSRPRSGCVCCPQTALLFAR